MWSNHYVLAQKAVFIILGDLNDFNNDNQLKNEVYLIEIHHSYKKLWLLEHEPLESAWSGTMCFLLNSKSLLYIYMAMEKLDLVRPVARGVRRTSPNLLKGPLFATKWAKNEVLWGGLGPKGPLSGVPHPPKIESGYGPAFLFTAHVGYSKALWKNRVASQQQSMSTPYFILLGRSFQIMLLMYWYVYFS